MIIARTPALAIACCLLAACANQKTYDPECSQSTQNFPELLACLRNEIARTHTPRQMEGNDVKLYTIQAQQISHSVARNQTSDFNGRVDLQNLYSNFRRRELADAEMAGASSPKKQ